jgi:hypothetical protein
VPLSWFSHPHACHNFIHVGKPKISEWNLLEKEASIEGNGLTGNVGVL